MFTLLLPLLLTTVPEPVDPDLEVLVVESTFDEAAVCPLAEEMFGILSILIDDEDLAIEFITAFAVEHYEDGYGRNLQRPAEIRLEELIEACVR